MSCETFPRIKFWALPHAMIDLANTIIPAKADGEAKHAVLGDVSENWPAILAGQGAA